MAGLGRRARGRKVGPRLYPEGRKSQGKTQGELRTAAKQRRKKEAMRIRQQGGKNKRRQPVSGGHMQQTGTTENSWKEMMCTLYHTISTAYELHFKLHHNYCVNSQLNFCGTCTYTR